MKVLLHICCSVCALGAFRRLRDEGWQVRGYFFNPNIHPLIEFRRRKKSVKVLQERIPLPVEYEEEYGLWDFLREVDYEGGEDRCLECYRVRLSHTAERAAELEADAFTTTLLTSPRQDPQALKRIGEECGAEHGVEFLFRNWQGLSEENRDEAKKMGLYHQQYCGCIFSEEERYRETTRHLYQGSGPASGDARWSEKDD